MACLFKRNGVYYVAILQDGKRLYKSTHARSKSEAVRFLVDLKKHLTTRKNVTLSAFFQDFLTFSLSNHAATTHNIYDRTSKGFLALVGDKHIQLVRPLEVERFKNARLENGLGPVSVNIELRAIKAMFARAVSWGLLEQNPCKSVSQIRIPDAAPVYLDTAQVETLLKSVSDPSFRDLVEFAIHTGMRRGEILNLTWENVDLPNRMLTVTSSPTFRTKTGKVHHVPMNEVVYHLLATKERNGEYVFTDREGRRYLESFVTHKFKKYILKAKLPESVHFHSLRHTFASLLAKAGVPLFDIQKLLNHSNITTTQVYSHLSQEHLRGSVERLVTTTN